MSTLSLTFAPGEEKQINSAFTKLLILSDGGTPVDIQVKNYRGSLQPLSGVQAGFGISSDEQPYTYVIIKSSVAQTVQLYLGDDDVVYNRLSGNVTLTGNLPGITNAVAINNEGSLPGSSYKSVAQLAANTPDVIFTPGANVNGAVVYVASLSVNLSAGAAGTILAKASAPSGITDGDVLASCSWPAAALVVATDLKNPIQIAAGKGLYRISSIAESNTFAFVLYKLK